MPSTLPAARPAWYRVTRIGLSLAPLIIVHLSLAALAVVRRALRDLAAI